MIRGISMLLMLVGGLGYWITLKHPIHFLFLILTIIGFVGQFFAQKKEGGK